MPNTKGFPHDVLDSSRVSAQALRRAVYDDPRWTALRWSIMRRDGFKCTSCGTGTGSGAHVHHIHAIGSERGRGREFDPTNLRTLCRSCHSAAHSKRPKKDSGWIPGNGEKWRDFATQPI